MDNKSIIAYKICTKHEGLYKSYLLPFDKSAVTYKVGKVSRPKRGENQFLFTFVSLESALNFVKRCWKINLENFAQLQPNLALFQVKAYNPTKTVSTMTVSQEEWLCSHLKVLRQLA